METRNAFDWPMFGHISKLCDLGDGSKKEVGAMTSPNYFNFWSLKEKLINKKNEMILLHFAVLQRTTGILFFYFSLTLERSRFSGQIILRSTLEDVFVI